jgi:superfamily II DNA/RNA helicase
MVKLTLDEIRTVDQQKLLSEMPSSDKNGTMIFLNTAERAQKFAQSWRNAGLECAEVHGLQSRKTRSENLKLFKEQTSSVLICTDACARGLDFPHVRAVVQVDFALNIVQHLHRIGRASRAGAKGFAINFYANSSNDLVTSVISHNHGDSSGIERSFSRRRGFRQKLKKGKISDTQDHCIM